MRKTIKQVPNLQDSLSPEETGNPLGGVSNLAPHKPLSIYEKKAQRLMSQQKEGFRPTPPTGAPTARPHVAQLKSVTMEKLSVQLASPTLPTHTASSSRFFIDSLNSESVLSLKSPTSTKGEQSPKLISIAGINSPTIPLTGSLNMRFDPAYTGRRQLKNSSVPFGFFHQTKQTSSTHSLHMTPDSNHFKLPTLDAGFLSSPLNSPLAQKGEPLPKLGSHSLSAK